MMPLATTEDPISNLSDEGSERAILACLMAEPTKMSEAIGRIAPEDFVNENNSYLFRIMVSVYHKNGGKSCKFDITTLQTLAREQKVEEQFIEKSGGSEYIEFLSIVKNSFIEVANFGSYVETVLGLSVKRKLYNNGQQFLQTIINSDRSPEELIIQEQVSIDELFASFSSSQSKLNNIGQFADEYLERTLSQKKEIIGLRTQFHELDNILEGLKRGTLTIVSAPRKTGKTAFLMNIGVNIGIKQKIPTLMISTEMSDEEILSRTLSCISSVQEKKIKKGDLTAEEKKRVLMAREQIKRGQFHHLTLRGFTVEKIIGCIRRFVSNIVGFDEKGKTKDCLVIFDYIKLPQQGVSSSRELKEYKVLGLIADSLKMQAGDLDVPVITACQTNRAGDVANSYELTWFCDTFMTLKNRPDKDVESEKESGMYKGNQKLTIDANRSGEENHNGIYFDYNRPSLQYLETGSNPLK